MRGVRQEYVLSPHLSNRYSEVIPREIENKPGMKVNVVNINNFRYADDTVKIVKNEAALNKVVSESEKKSLQIYVENTECMFISTEKQMFLVRSNN